MEWAYVSGDHWHVASRVLFGGTGWGRRAHRADGGVTVLGTGLGGDVVCVHVGDQIQDGGLAYVI